MNIPLDYRLDYPLGSARWLISLAYLLGLFLIGLFLIGLTPIGLSPIGLSPWRQFSLSNLFHSRFFLIIRGKSVIPLCSFT